MTNFSATSCREQVFVYLNNAVNRNANKSSILIGPISKQESNKKLPIVYKYLF